MSILDAARTVTRALGARQEPRVSGKFRVGDVRHCYADLTLARRTLGYEPQVRFQDGINGMAGWLRDQYSEDPSERAAGELAERGLLGVARS